MALLLVCLSLTLTLYRAFALKTLWAWFIVPTFGLTELSIPLAIGLSCLSLVFRPSETMDEIEKVFEGISNEKHLMLYGYSFLQTTILLCCGWTMTLFVR